ncbi:HSP20-like chaperone [Schizophyllum amplum]|uniref:HSP20-like chaperone n=1 Tax=Schizophyllum amplum TaxID=97359 RepID=A0A550CHS7_9AGAR|nr:HSP20-like chaperone [Auriculariopsis ampla]
MSVFSYEPFYDFDRLLTEVFTPRTNGDDAQRRIEGDAPRALKPRMDLHEDAEKNTVTATFEFPGVKKDNVQLEVHNGRLTVGAETKVSEERDENGYAVRERRYGKWSRTLQLPDGVKEEEIKATMENGVLTVTFPKTSPEAAPKKITVN